MGELVVDAMKEEFCAVCYRLQETWLMLTFGTERLCETCYWWAFWILNPEMVNLGNVRTARTLR